MISPLTKIDTSMQKVGTTPTWFSSFEKFFHGILCVNGGEYVCMCTIHMVRVEVQVEQVMYNSIINLRGPIKSHKDKSRFRVSKIPYKTQDMEQNTSNSSII